MHAALMCVCLKESIDISQLLKLKLVNIYGCTLNITLNYYVSGTTTTPSRVVQRYVLKVTIRMQIEDCSNPVQMKDVIQRYILNRLQYVDTMFPALCAGDCGTDLSCRFLTGCLSSSQRKKRSSTQDVEMQLNNVTCVNTRTWDTVHF